MLWRDWKCHTYAAK